MTEERSATDICSRLMCGMFGTVIEFDTEKDWCRCICDSSDAAGALFSGMRVLTEDALGFIGDHFEFAEPEDGISALFNEVRSGGSVVEKVSFTYLSQTYSGMLMGCNERLLLGFNADVPDDAKANSVQPARQNDEVCIRMAKNTDVFVNGKPVFFSSKKSRELVGLLVSRQGGFLSSKEAAALLWPDEPVSVVLLARYRKVAMRLHETLIENGINYIVENVNGNRRLDFDRVRLI